MDIDPSNQSLEQQSSREDLDTLRSLIGRMGFEGVREALFSIEGMSAEKQPLAFVEPGYSVDEKDDLRLDTAPTEGAKYDKENDMNAQMCDERNVKNVGKEVEQASPVMLANYRAVISEITPGSDDCFIEVMIAKGDSRVGIRLQITQELLEVLPLDKGDLKFEGTTIVALHEAYAKLYVLACEYQEKLQDVLLRDVSVSDSDEKLVDESIGELRDLQTAACRLRYEAYFRRNRFAKAILSSHRGRGYSLIVPSATSS